MAGQKATVSRDARLVLDRVKADIAGKRPAGARPPTDTDAILHLARECEYYS